MAWAKKFRARQTSKNMSTSELEGKLSSQAQQGPIDLQAKAAARTKSHQDRLLAARRQDEAKANERQKQLLETQAKLDQQAAETLERRQGKAQGLDWIMNGTAWMQKHMAARAMEAKFADKAAAAAAESETLNANRERQSLSSSAERARSYNRHKDKAEAAVCRQEYQASASTEKRQAAGGEATKRLVQTQQTRQEAEAAAGAQNSEAPYTPQAMVTGGTSGMRPVGASINRPRAAEHAQTSTGQLNQPTVRPTGQTFSAGPRRIATPEENAVRDALSDKHSKRY